MDQGGTQAERQHQRANGTELSVSPSQKPTIEEVTYVVRDASCLGFGSVSWSRKERKICAMVGVWNDKTRDNSSSNFQEAANLVRRLKIMLEEERLEQGSEVFVFTDNSTFERTYRRGLSTSKLLHEVILELRKIKMSGKLILHVIWFSGRRMIHQGSDGLSRGDFSSGVMGGQDFLKFIPLNKTAFDRKTKLKAWLLNKKNLGRKLWKLAEPDHWFFEVLQDPLDWWIWFPAPAITKIADEQMCKAKLLLPKSSHVSFLNLSFLVLFDFVFLGFHTIHLLFFVAKTL